MTAATSDRPSFRKASRIEATPQVPGTESLEKTGPALDLVKIEADAALEVEKVDPPIARPAWETKLRTAKSEPPEKDHSLV